MASVRGVCVLARVVMLAWVLEAASGCSSCAADSEEPPPGARPRVDMASEELGQADPPDASRDMRSPPDMTQDMSPGVMRKNLLDLKVKPNARGLDRATLVASLRSYDPQSGRLVFDAGDARVAALKVGDVLAAEVSPKSPYGFLRAVEGVTREGDSLILSTRQAYLPEVISGKMSLELDTTGLPRRQVGVDDGSGVRVTARPPALSSSQQFHYDVVFYDHDGVPQTGDEIKIGMSAGYDMMWGLEADINIDIGIFPPSLDVYLTLGAGASVSQFAQIYSQSGYEGPVHVTKTLDAIEFAPITVWFVIPLVFIPKLEPRLTLSGQAARYTHSVREDFNFYAGVFYRSGQGWRIGVDGPRLGFQEQFTIPGRYAQGQLNYQLGAKASLKLYDAAGPWVSSDIGLRHAIQKPSESHWSLEGTLRADAGLEVNTPFGDFGVQRNIFMWSEPIAQATRSTALPELLSVEVSLFDQLDDLGESVGYIVNRPVSFYVQAYDEIQGSSCCEIEITTAGPSQPTRDRLALTFSQPGTYAVTFRARSRATGLLSAPVVRTITVVSPQPRLFVLAPQSGSIYARVPFGLVVSTYDPTTPALPCSAVQVAGRAADQIAPEAKPAGAPTGTCYFRVVLDQAGANTLTLTVTNAATGKSRQMTQTWTAQPQPATQPPYILPTKPTPNFQGVVLLGPSESVEFGFDLVNDPDSSSFVWQRVVELYSCADPSQVHSAQVQDAPFAVATASLPRSFVIDFSATNVGDCNALSTKRYRVIYRLRGANDTIWSELTWTIHVQGVIQ